MKVYYSLEALPNLVNTVVTIGSFDGVHSGHQKILERVKQLAQSIDSESVVITFHPHPRLVLKPDDPSVKLLTLTEEKVELLKKYGIDIVVVVPFTKDFSEQSPKDYIQNFLVKYFQPAYIVIGYDHHFGAKRAGNIELLRQYQKECDYEVIEIEKQVIDELEVSSTKIRKALEKSDLITANKLLGHFYSFSGKVVKGQQLGREIGFPTANLEIKDKHKLIIPHGIYAVFVWFEGEKYRGMLYRGDRPVLKDFDNVTIEVNIFDFKEEIYDKNLKVELVNFIRPDKYFESLEELVIQLADDERACREILQNVENQVYPKVAIVILNYNTPQFLRQFLPSVCGSRYGNMDVFVADNGSTDNSVDTVRELNLEGIPAYNGIDRVRVIELGANYGFAKGYNMALQHPKLLPKSFEHPDGYEYYILLNSDCRVSQGWILPVIDLMENDKTIAIAQPKILSYTKKRRFEYAGASGGFLDILGYPLSRGRIFETIEKDKKQYDSTAEIFWASGAAMFIKADLWHKFEGFDADYFAHMEEIDLCWRVKNAGYRVMAEPKGVVRHVGGGTLDYLNPRKTYLNFRNSLYTIFKNETMQKLIWLLPTRLLLDGVAGIRFLFKGQYKHVFSILKAHFSFYGEIFNLINKRKKYAQIIEKQRIGRPNKQGVLRGVIIWRYYIKGQKTFNELINKVKSNENDDDTDEDD
jgi:riboflavin kinase/FMN adenylyltransferase